MTIVGMSGSLRKGSFNTALLRAMQALAPEGVTIDIADIGNLPLYNRDDEDAYPGAAQSLKDAVHAADAVILVTPEYNRSVPGVLKNAIDWLSRPNGANVFVGKPVLVAGVSSGKIGTAVAQSHLKQILVYLEANVLGQPELYLGPARDLFDEQGALTNDSTKQLIEKALAALVQRVSV